MRLRKDEILFQALTGVKVNMRLQREDFKLNRKLKLTWGYEGMRYYIKP
jgi:hypothetical protein